MTIPFRDLFNKAKARLLAPRPVAAPPPAPVRPTAPAKRPDERLSKTVLPNMTRTLTPPDPFRMTAGSSTAVKMRGRDVPPAVALASEPVADRSIALQLSDILEELPVGYIKPREGFDTERLISLKGAEVEKGMASGQPTVSLATIYEQVPEIFVRSVSPGDMTQVPLPFAKILQQIENLHVRSDQLSDQAVPQVETPFLQVTIEDNDRFGTTLPQLQTSAEPPVKVQPATAETISKAEPEPVAKFTSGGAGRASIPVTPPNQPPTPPAFDPSSPARIPFNLPPNGAGAPASERVPASSGPPVPIPPSKPTTPARIPFNLTPDVRPKRTLVPGVDPKEEVAPSEPSPAARSEERKMRLSLDAVMRNVPAFQLKGSLPEIPKDVRLELPCSLIEPQLASGRVSIDPKIFQAAIPEPYRDLFVVDSTETPVLLPLQEVLKNLSADVLQMRSDQLQEEKIDYFETPFSRHADEDKMRFGGTEKAAAGTESVPKAESPTPDTAAEPVMAEATTPMPEALAGVSATEKSEPKREQSKAKEFVERVTALPGIAGCSITFADGLSLGGNIPEEIAAEGLCAMAPSLLQKIEKHMLETKLGPLTAMTLHCAKSPISFFMKGTVCLAVLHSNQKLASATRDKLAEMVKELSQIYTQPETADVHH